MTEMEI